MLAQTKLRWNRRAVTCRAPAAGGHRGAPRQLLPHARAPASFAPRAATSIPEQALPVTDPSSDQPQTAAATQPSPGSGGAPSVQMHSLDPSLPFLLYLPNLDGTGITCKPQWQRMAAHYNLHTLAIPADNRWSFAQLAQFVKDQLRGQLQGNVEPEQTVYLMGEGFGALLALAAAADVRLVNRLVLVNPATSYRTSPMARVMPLLARLPPHLHAALAAALSPDSPGGLLGALSSGGSSTPGSGGSGLAAQLLAQPMQLFAGLAGRLPLVGAAVQSAVDQLARGVSDLPGQEDARMALLELLPEVQRLVASLPPDTLAWRLDVTLQGCRHLEPLLHGVEQRTLVLAGGLDLLLPSAQEGGRLARLMPRAFCITQPARSHLMLCEPGFDLVEALQWEGFCAAERRFTSPPVISSSGGFDGDVCGSLGAAGPAELPSSQEVARYSRQWAAPIRALSSPVFLSTDADGRVVQGLGGVPNDSRPIIFVGNHQLWAFDMNVLVEELLLQRGLLLRGLAHPVLFRDNAGNTGDVRDPRTLAHQTSNVFKTFGAVPVTPTSYYRLLQRGEAVLVYPGGVREGFKRRGEKYQLFWPQRPELVRMAAKFGATVVPVASVGAEDAVRILLDSDELREHPLLGRTFRELAAQMPEARVGVADGEEYDQSFISPLLAPAAPARQYYLAMRPIQLQPADYSDKDKCGRVYAHVKAEVEAGIRYLLERRGADPFQHLLPRLAYEHTPGAPRRQAPSFPLE